MGDYFWQKKPWQAFKNFAIIFSFIVYFVVLLVLLLAAPLILPAVDTVARPLVGGLSVSFVQMGEASIERTIAVQLDAGVDIPLQDTELGRPFSKLQELFVPLNRFLNGIPASNQELFERISGRDPAAHDPSGQTSVPPE